MTPYCGNCHKFMTEMFHNIWVCDCTVSGQAADTTKDPNCHNSHHDHYDALSPIVLARQAEYAAERQGGCTCIGRMVDYTGAPCPVHPIIEEEEADEPLGEILPLHPEVVAHPWEETEACGHYKDADGVCTFWGCSTRGSLVDGTPFFDTIDELDEILEDTNRQVDNNDCTNCGHDEHYSANHREPNNPCGAGGCPCTQYLPYRVVEQTEVGEILLDRECDVDGHVWVRYGKAGFNDQGLSVMDVGPEICLRCQEPAPVEEGECICSDGWVRTCPAHPMLEGSTMPEKGFVAREGPTDRPGEVFSAICAGCGSSTGNESRALCLVCGPKHACAGCNLRDLTMKDAKEHISKLLGLIGWTATVFGLVERSDGQNTQDIRREAAAFLRMSERKIRAMEGG